MKISLNVKDVVEKIEKKEEFLFKLKKILRKYKNKRKMKSKILKDDFILLDIKEDVVVFQYHDIKIKFKKSSNKIEDILKSVAENLEVE